MPTQWSLTRLRRLRVALILLLAFALYSPSLANGYAFDDRFVALAVRDDGQPNRMVHTLQPLGDYFTTNYWQGVYPGDVLYRPITTLSIALLHAWFGRHAASETGQAFPQHLANVLLHVLCTWLAYRLARRAGLARLGASVASLAFGVHAIHSEVVAGVVGRSELLAFACGAAMVLVASGRELRPGRALAAACLAFLAFASKESAVAWAAVLPLFLLLRRPAFGTVLRRTLLVAGPSLALFLALRATMIAGLPVVATADVVDPWTVRATGTVGWGWGLATSLLPLHLACDHGPAVFAPVASPLDPRFLAAAAALLGVVAFACLAWKRAPQAAAGAGVFLLTSVLVANVLFPIGVPFAERLYYTPSFGMCLAAGALAVRLRPQARRAAGAAFAGWLVWSAFLVLQRNPLWADDAALFAHEYENQPRSARIALNWAGVLRRLGRDEELRPVLERVVELDPHLAAAWNELGVRAMRAGDTERAVAHFTACLSARRQDSDVHRLALENLVRVHLARNEAAQAVAAVERFAAVEPATVAHAFTGLQDALGSAASLPWILSLADRLQQAAPQARDDWDRQRALACFKRKAFDDAARWVRAWLPRTTDPVDHARMTLLLANAQLEANDRAGARQTLADLLGRPGLSAELRQAALDLERRLGGTR